MHFPSLFLWRSPNLQSFISAKKNFNFNRYLSRRWTSGDSHIFFFINFDQIKIIYKGNKKMSYIHKKELTKQICARAYIYIYIYIYIERERERERDSFIGLDDVILTHIPPYPTVYGHNWDLQFFTYWTIRKGQ